MEYNRQPCPIRIVEDCGCAFLMGTTGGSLFQFLKGYRNSPTGLRRGLYGGFESLKLRTPAIAGSFAIWGATFSTVDCLMISYRQRDDHWNSVLSGAATGGILAARNGIRAMANSAFVGCLVLAMLEGAGTAVATIYASDEDGATVFDVKQPERPQWEASFVNLVDSEKKTSSIGQELAISEFGRVLDKCRVYRARKLTLQDTGLDILKGKEQERMEPSPSLLDLVKLADII
ncbi:probable mitochondrial import inner membrane translocase subunit Tim17 4 [Drosophila ficusphila]|uniref:probable mitochondrial import inner membrane translocase subunit Tim17 4 n=1 Tax=Drosophila ficusphila TaxID=30025 RepID=UPI0007E836E7|nr:probable mitochondrial import inner membrane translocase subunit Tim17 4 [Drosophila ficusphila]